MATDIIEGGMGMGMAGSQSFKNQKQKIIFNYEKSFCFVMWMMLPRERQLSLDHIMLPANVSYP